MQAMRLSLLLFADNIIISTRKQWRSEGNWRPGAKLNFAPPPLTKILKNDIEMSIVLN